MWKKYQPAILGALLLVLAVIVYLSFRGSSAPPVAFSTTQNYPPIGVENPELQRWKIKAAQKTGYPTTMSHRNIFDATPLPPPVDVSKLPPTPAVAVQPVEQPVFLPVKFFGYGQVPASGRRRAFFTNGEDVYIVAEGETLLGQFRVLRIGNANLDFEVINSGRRGSVALEEQGPSA
jgi:hypothetical protein